MAKLINGNGNPAVYANEDSDLLAAIMGNQTSITAIGEQFRADQADANTIEVFDGVIITKEGRRIQLDANQVDLFEIPTGTQGQTNYYIIGYHLYTDTDSNQFCEIFVQLMESASDTIPEDTFRGGADDVYISLYRVTQDGLNIDSIDLLLPTISTISEINADLSVFKFRVNNGVPQFSVDGGTTWINLGGGTMKCALFGTLTLSANRHNQVNISSLRLTSADDYVVYISGDGMLAGVSGGSTVSAFTTYLSAKTSSSFSIWTDIARTVSYQVITFN